MEEDYGWSEEFEGGRGGAPAWSWWEVGAHNSKLTLRCLQGERAAVKGVTDTPSPPTPRRNPWAGESGHPSDT